MSEKIFERLNEGSGVYFEATLLERRQTAYQLLEALDPADVLVERLQRGRDLPLKKRVANG